MEYSNSVREALVSLTLYTDQHCLDISSIEASKQVFSDDTQIFPTPVATESVTNCRYPTGSILSV